MKCSITFFLILIIFLFFTNLFAQIQFTPNTITTGADEATSVYAADVDGDGDMDVLSASGYDDKIAWYENLDPADIANNDPEVVQVRPLLYNNYPNPFNPSTTIEFTLPKSEFTTLKVFNILGKEVATLVSNKLNQGNHTYTFDGKNLASGIYYYSIQAGDFHQDKKMILIK